MLDRTATTTRILDEVLIDELGFLRAKMAVLEIAEKQTKAQLAHLPPGAYEGNTFRLAVIESTRESLDSPAVRETFAVSNGALQSVAAFAKVARQGLRTGMSVENLTKILRDIEKVAAAGTFEALPVKVSNVRTLKTNSRNGKGL